MKNFTISTQTVWFLVIGGICIAGFGIFADSQDWFLSQQFLTIGSTLLFTSWIIVFLEIVNNKIYDRTSWILFMLILAPVTIIFYLIQREKLFRLGKTKFHNYSN